jgi:glycosyltransferase involved in cell wall biosynthesis
LHWVGHSPSPYNDVLYGALAKSHSLALQVHYLYAESPAHGWLGNADPGYLFRISRRRPVDWALARAVLGDPASLFLTQCWQDPTSQLILTALMLMRRPYLIWSDTPRSGGRNWVKEHLRACFLSTIFRRAAAVLGTGTPALRAFANLGAPAAKLVSLPCCVDLDTFVPRQAERAADTVVLGTCCRLDRIKGLDLALQALSRIRDSRGPTIRYRIAGSGPEQQSLQALTADLGLVDRVEFCGWLQPDALPAFYHSLDAYLHPARFEPFGVAVIEALACGLPVLASEQTMAAVERIGDGVVLFRSDDEADLLRALRIFLNLDPQDRMRMRDGARRAALDWPVERAVSTVERLVDEIFCGAAKATPAAVERTV